MSKVVHLWRNVCDGCKMWCEGTVEGGQIYLEEWENGLDDSEEGVASISKVTCLKCLETACHFGDAVRKRRDELGAAK